MLQAVTIENFLRGGKAKGSLNIKGAWRKNCSNRVEGAHVELAREAHKSQQKEHKAKGVDS